MMFTILFIIKKAHEAEIYTLPGYIHSLLTPPVIATKFQFHPARTAVRCVINKLTVKLDIRRQQQKTRRVFYWQCTE